MKPTRTSGIPRPEPSVALIGKLIGDAVEGLLEHSRQTGDRGPVHVQPVGVGVS